MVTEIVVVRRIGSICVLIVLPQFISITPSYKTIYN